MLDLDESLHDGRIPLLLELRLLSVLDPKASNVFRDPSMHVKDVPLAGVPERESRDLQYWNNRPQCQLDVAQGGVDVEVVADCAIQAQNPHGV